MDRFFELIRIALGNQDSFSVTPLDEEWEFIYAMANRHGIPGVLFDAFTRLPKEQMPPDHIMADWIMCVHKAEERNILLTKQTAYATKTFMKYGFRSVIIKGQSLAQYFSNPLHRHSSDIDIWVEGDRKAIVEYVSSVKKPKNILYHHCDFDVIKGTSIEVHFTPSYFICPFTNRRFQKWVERNGNRMFPKCDSIKEGFNSPDASFNIPYLLTHFFRHVIDEELLMKPVIDYYFLLMSTPLDDKQKKEYMETLSSFSLGRFTAGVMYILKEICGMKEECLLCQPNERYGKFLIKELFKEDADKGCLAKGKSNSNHIRRFIKRECNLLRFLPLFPKEIIWSPYWAIKIFILLRRNR